jgi:phospholipid N-methyltransferase
METEQRSSIIGQAASLLSSTGVLTQFQYLHAGAVPHWLTAGCLPRFSEPRFLREYFRQVWSETVLRNVPPASVYTCRI